jgi:uncharacterized protein YjdB
MDGEYASQEFTTSSEATPETAPESGDTASPENAITDDDSSDDTLTVPETTDESTASLTPDDSGAAADSSDTLAGDTFLPDAPISDVSGNDDLSDDLSGLDVSGNDDLTVTEASVPLTIDPVVEYEDNYLEELTVDTLPDEYALFAQYIDDLFGVDYYESETTAAGLQTLPTYNSFTYDYLNDTEQAFFNYAVDIICRISSGDLSNTDITLAPEDLGLSALPIVQVPDLYNCTLVNGQWQTSLNSSKYEQARQSIDAAFNIDQRKIINALCFDRPQYMYWFGRTFSIGVDSYQRGTAPGATVNLSPGSTTTGTCAGYVSVTGYRIYLSVSKSYCVYENGSPCPDKADTAKTRAGLNALDNARQIVENCVSLNDYDKLLSYKESICNLATYNHAAAGSGVSSMGSDPWELVYVFDGNPDTNVVCEGYSKAFQYLCDASSFTNNVDVICVNGKMNNGSHMWNIVKFNNDNYLVDVTNCDNAEDFFPDGHTALFMKGFDSGSYDTSYVIKGEVMTVPGTSHGVVSTYDITYSYGNDLLSLYSGHTDRLVLSATDYGVTATSNTTVTGTPVKEIWFYVNQVGALTLDMPGNTSYPVQLVFIPDNATNKDVDITTSNSSIAFAYYYEPYIYIYSRAAGTAYITVTAKDGSGVSATLAVTVSERLGITSQPTDVTAGVGETFAFNIGATGVASYKWQYRTSANGAWIDWPNGNTSTLTGTMTAEMDGRQVWCVLQDEQGHVQESEIVTLRLGQSSTVPVTNVAFVINNNSSSNASYSIYQNATFVPTVIIEPTNATNTTLTWSSSNPNVATVNSNGMIRGIAPGTATITATTTDGSRKSATITITVCAPLAITTQPTNVTGTVGGTYSFTVAATGTGLSYQWYYRDSDNSNWTAWQNGTSSTLTGTITAAMNGRQVYCCIMDATGQMVNSSTATLTVNVPVTNVAFNVNNNIVNTTSINIYPGDTYQPTLVVEPSNATDKTVTWSSSNTGVATVNTNGTIIGVAPGTATITATSADGSRKSATITVTVYAPLAITQQPTDVTAKAGDRFTFSVTATGTGLTYDWKYQWPGQTQWISWANGKTDTLTGTMQAGWTGLKVKCVITDANGTSIESDTVTLSLPAISITRQPANANVAAGSQFNFTVAATGTGRTYDWKYQWPGQTQWISWAAGKTDTLTGTMQAGWTGLKVKCVITDANGTSIESDTVTLSLPTVSITRQPVNANVAAGSQFNFTVAATGNGLTYDWKYQWPGQTQWISWSAGKTDTLTGTMQAGWTGLKVKCVITDADGNIIESNIVTLSL